MAKQELALDKGMEESLYEAWALVEAQEKTDKVPKIDPIIIGDEAENRVSVPPEDPSTSVCLDPEYGSDIIRPPRCAHT